MKTDVVIVGGGAVGLLAAVALQHLGVSIALFEARPSRDDGRSVALSEGSRVILESLGVWQAIADQACAIDQIHVSDRGRMGFARLSAAAQSVEALGYVVSLHALQMALQAAIDPERVQLFCPATVVNTEIHPDMISLRVDAQGQTISCDGQLLLAADGMRSSLAKQAGICFKEQNYGQVGVVANITLARCHRHIAYERFTESGPLAMLPLADKTVALVWSLYPEQAESIMALDTANFLQELQQAFGYRLGKLVGATKRVRFPLQLVLPEKPFHGRMLLFGNAAHTLHPIAGQGFNLCVRDVAYLVESIAEARAAQQDIGCESVLSGYIATRQQDQREIIGITDTLVKAFSSRVPPIAWVRDLGLSVTERCSTVHHIFAKRMMGKAHIYPPMSRGIKV